MLMDDVTYKELWFKEHTHT